MAAEDPKAVLSKVRADAHKLYSRNPARLHQLDSALATAAMALDHLADEEFRHADLARRVAEDETTNERSRHQLLNLHPGYKEKR